jgi:hypothetical protein
MTMIEICVTSEAGAAHPSGAPVVHEKPTSNRWAINSHLSLGESQWYIQYIVSTNSHSHLFGVVCLWMQTCDYDWDMCH